MLVRLATSRLFTAAEVLDAVELPAVPATGQHILTTYEGDLILYFVSDVIFVDRGEPVLVVNREESPRFDNVHLLPGADRLVR